MAPLIARPFSNQTRCPQCGNGREIRVHYDPRGLRVTADSVVCVLGDAGAPALAAGVIDRLWSMDDLVALIDAWDEAQPRKKAGRKPKVQPAKSN